MAGTAYRGRPAGLAAPGDPEPRRALRLLRLRRGMRQYDLAGRAHVTKAMLSAYENRRRLRSLRTPLQTSSSGSS